MNLTLYKSFAALLIFAVSLIAAIYPLAAKLRPKQNESLELGEAFASGIFLGVAFFHMLPEANQTFQALWPATHYPLAELFCIIGFILLLWLERLAYLSNQKNPTHTVPYILTIILIIHSLIEGTALGINTVSAEAFMIFIAIITHKGSDSFALCSTLIRHNWSFGRTLTAIIFLSLMTPLGILFGASLTLFLGYRPAEIATAIFNGFAAGTFIYIATLYHVRFHQRAHDEEAKNGLLEFLFLLMGLSLMGAIVWWG